MPGCAAKHRGKAVRGTCASAKAAERKTGLIARRAVGRSGIPIREDGLARALGRRQVHGAQIIRGDSFVREVAAVMGLHGRLQIEVVGAVTGWPGTSRLPVRSSVRQ